MPVVSMRSAKVVALALSMIAGAAMIPPANAQCGYGTSEQDCQHQQRDAEARRQEEGARRAEEERATQQAGYESGTTDYGGPPPHRWVSGIASFAYHPDARDVWTVWDARDSTDAAVSRAVAECNLAMGSGCMPGTWVENGSIAIGRDQNGIVAYSVGPNPKEAEKGMHDYCKRIQQVCQPLRTISSKPWEEVATTFIFDRTKTASPKRRDVVVKSATVAWPAKYEAGKPWSGTVWLVSGVEGVAQVQQRAVANCERVTATKCVAGHYVTGANLVQFRASDGVVYWSGVLDRSQASRMIQQACEADKLKCSVIAEFDSGKALELEIRDSPSR